MKKLVPLGLVAGAASLLISGCASTAKHLDSDSSRTVLTTGKINLQDWNMATEDLTKKMQDEFINQGKLQSADGPGKPALMAISRIVNNTSTQFDNDVLVKPIRIALLQTGKIVFDTTAALGGPEDPLADASKRQDVFTTGQKLRRPDYTLSGKILEDKSRVGNTREVTYFFQFSLSSPDGLAVWEGERRITKQGNKSSVGW